MKKHIALCWYIFFSMSLNFIVDLIEYFRINILENTLLILMKENLDFSHLILKWVFFQYTIYDYPIIQNFYNTYVACVPLPQAVKSKPLNYFINESNRTLKRHIRNAARANQLLDSIIKEACRHCYKQQTFPTVYTVYRLVSVVWCGSILCVNGIVIDSCLY